MTSQRLSKRSNHFPGYPHIRRVAYSERYGRMELISIDRTSDGYLIGTAKIGEPGPEQFVHSIFLGSAKP